MQEKSVDNLITGIEKSKSAGFPALLYCLGIRSIGETSSRNLSRSFRCMEKLMAADYEQLIEVEYIGEQMANSLLKYFARIENRILIEGLLKYGVDGEREEQDEENNIIEGQSFVITGTLSRPREKVKEIILSGGGKVSD